MQTGLLSNTDAPQSSQYYRALVTRKRLYSKFGESTGTRATSSERMAPGTVKEKLSFEMEVEGSTTMETENSAVDLCPSSITKSVKTSGAGPLPSRRKTETYSCDPGAERLVDEGSCEQRSTNKRYYMHIESVYSLGQKSEWTHSQPTKTMESIASLSIEIAKRRTERKLTSKACDAIKSLLKKLPNIVSFGLQLPNHKIDCAGFAILNGSLQSLSRLQLLIVNLNGNCVSGKSFLEFASQVHLLKNLKNIGITLERIKFSLLDAFDLIKGLCKLSHLSFDKCSFLSDQISYNQAEGRLNNLCVMMEPKKGRAKLGDQGCELLADALEDMQNLNSVFLEIPHNQIYRRGFMHLAASLKAKEKVKNLYLNLDGNKLNDECLKGLSSSILALSKLSSLIINLGKNNITDLGFEAIRTAILSKNRLLSLRLSVNSTKIGSSALKTFSESILQLASLVSLVVDINAPGTDFESLRSLLERAALFPLLTKIIIVIPSHFLKTADYYDQLKAFVQRSDVVRLVTKRRETGVNISRAFTACLSSVSLRKEIKREIFGNLLMDSVVR